MAQRIGLSADDHLLDIGCGAGGPARHMAEMFGCTVTGLDREFDRLLMASVRTRFMGLQRKVDFRHGDATQIPFNNRTFNVVWSQGTLPFAGHLKTIFQECFRVLDLHGTLALQAPFFTDRHSPADDHAHPDYLKIWPRNYLSTTLQELKNCGFQQIEASWMEESEAYYREAFPEAAAWFRDRKYGSFMIIAKRKTL